jgi:hypothetical protein
VVVNADGVGKTLCYNLPVLNAVLENPDTRALYLFSDQSWRSPSARHGVRIAESRVYNRAALLERDHAK